MDKILIEAFTLIKKDKDYGFKLLILALLFIPTLYVFYNEAKFSSNLNFANIGLMGFLTMFSKFSFLFLILNSITYPFIWGYLSSCTHNVINNVDNEQFLPNWEDDFFNYFGIGIKYSIAIAIIGIALIIPGIISIGLLFLLFIFLYPALNNVFCRDYDLKAFFQWKKAYSYVKVNSNLYWAIFGYYILIKIAIQIINYLFETIKAPVLLETIFTAIVTAYFMTALAYMTGLIGKVLSETEQIDVPQ